MSTESQKTKEQLSDGEQDPSETYDASRVEVSWNVQLQDTVASFSVHPNGQLFLTADASGAVSLLSTRDGSRLWVSPKAHNFGATYARWISPDRFISFGLDAKIKLWMYDEARQTEPRQPSDRSNLCEVIKSPQIKASWILSDLIVLPERVSSTWNCHYALGIDRRIVFFNREWDVVKESEPLSSTITGLVYNDKMCAMLATAYGKINIVVFSELFGTGEGPTITQKEKDTFIVKGSFLCLSQTSNGLLVAGGMQDDMVQIWDLKEACHYELGGYQGKVISVNISSNNAFMASCGGSVTTVWRISDIQKAEAEEPTQYTLHGHRHLVEGLLFHPTRNILLSYGKDGLALFWNFQGREANKKKEYNMEPDTLYMRPYKEILGKNTCTGIAGITSVCWANDNIAVLGYADGKITGVKVEM